MPDTDFCIQIRVISEKRRIDMANKPKNLESIRNQPGGFYYTYKHILIYSGGFGHSPQVMTHRVKSSENVDKIRKWLKLSKIPFQDIREWETVIKKYPKKGMSNEQIKFYESNQIPLKNGKYILKTRRMKKVDGSKFDEWVNLIYPLIHIFDLSKNERKELFSIYRESIIAKHISVINELNKNIDSLPIPEIDTLKEIRNKYHDQLRLFKATHGKTGHHKLLYPFLLPLIDELLKAGFTKYRLQIISGSDEIRVIKIIKNPLEILFKLFGYNEYNIQKIIKTLKG
jgi:hypothetical protein